MKMRLMVAIAAGTVLSGCASTITAVKGRSFGDHPLKPNTVYVATGDRRYAFAFDGGRVCVEPQPDYGVAIGAKSDPTLAVPSVGQAGAEDGVNPVGQVTTTRSERSDILQHQLFALCMARANGDLNGRSMRRQLEALTEAAALNIGAPATVAPAPADTKPAAAEAATPATTTPPQPVSKATAHRRARR